MIKSAFPIITTSGLTRLIEFYTDLLGGRISYQFPREGEPEYVGIDLGSSHLGIGQENNLARNEAQRFSLWVYVDDCDDMADRLREGGARVIREPTDEPWGERVAKVADPDGNVVVLGSVSG